MTAAIWKSFGAAVIVSGAYLWCVPAGDPRAWIAVWVGIATLVLVLLVIAPRVNRQERG